MQEPGVRALGTRSLSGRQLRGTGDIGKASRRRGSLPDPFALLALFLLLQRPLVLLGHALLAFELLLPVDFELDQSRQVKLNTVSVIPVNDDAVMEREALRLRV